MLVVHLKATDMAKSSGRLHFALKQHEAGWAIVETGAPSDRIVVICAKDHESEATVALLNRPAKGSPSETDIAG